MGLDYAALSRAKVKLTDEIPKIQRLVDRHDKDTARIVVAEWRRLFGYQHGKICSVALGTDQTFLAKVPGGQTVHLVASDSSISLATGLSALVFMEAFGLYIDRCENPAG
ncbi:hypothetical protein [Arsenicicoccus dermatophilus]|uniref:hypothetical protein n=1 Tax=Arsenicicoccus dermatophilus TaxID=1076331 RepID=UPI00391709AB